MSISQQPPGAPRGGGKKKSEGLSCRAGAGCGRGLGVTEAKFEALKRTGRCVKGEMTVEIPAAGRGGAAAELSVRDEEAEPRVALRADRELREENDLMELHTAERRRPERHQSAREGAGL